jgi:hypothetical protein
LDAQQSREQGEPFFSENGTHAHGSNGAHAYKTRKDAWETYGAPQNYRDSTMILGSIALWGKVIEHERGYRGEFAYPLHLYVPMPSQGAGSDGKFAKNVARLLANTYGCEAETFTI